MSEWQFDSPFTGSTSDDNDDDMIEITIDDLNIAATTSIDIAPAGSNVPMMLPPLQVARDQYGVVLTPPNSKQELFVGIARQPNNRSEEEEKWPLFATQPLRRQVQILTFMVEIRDTDNNVVELIPVEVRAHSISGVLPSEGTPVGVYGRRDKDGMVRTYDVVNLQTRSALTVMKLR